MKTTNVATITKAVTTFATCADITTAFASSTATAKPHIVITLFAITLSTITTITNYTTYY